MKLFLIRHGKTRGNLEKRYLGRTDEGLCREGREEIREKLSSGVYRGVEETEYLFVSPMKRCLETASILLPGREPVVIPSFREIDFGEFEGKNYRELSGNPSYQAWIDSGGRTPFPGGESREAFAGRCREGMAQALAWVREQAAGEVPVSCAESGFSQSVLTMVVHGGTIMALLSSLGGGGGYYDYQCGAGDGYCCQLTLREDGRLLLKNPLLLSA